MSEFLEQIRALIGAGEIRISDHGYDELAEDRLTAREVVAGIQEAIVVERRMKTKHVHEGLYVAEVEVELIEDEAAWSPYLSFARSCIPDFKYTP